MDAHPRWTESLYLVDDARPTGGDSRLDAIRERVRSGYYASPAAVEALASCLLASGAL